MVPVGLDPGGAAEVCDVAIDVARAIRDACTVREPLFPAPRTPDVYTSWPALTFNRVTCAAGVKAEPARAGTHGESARLEEPPSPSDTSRAPRGSGALTGSRES